MQVAHTPAFLGTFSADWFWSLARLFISSRRRSWRRRHTHVSRVMIHRAEPRLLFAGLAINDVMLTEGNAGTATAIFTVTLLQPNALATTVNFATSNSSATAPGDYQSSSGTLTFNPGEITKTVNVLVSGDTLQENNEVFLRPR